MFPPFCIQNKSNQAKKNFYPRHLFHATPPALPSHSIKPLKRQVAIGLFQATFKAAEYQRSPVPER
jgi:hypothetical protein